MNNQPVSPDEGRLALPGHERNRYRASPAPFLTIPAWWRRFLFRVLSPREFTVYAYLCSLSGPGATAFPTFEQIAYELGLRDPDSLQKPIHRICKLGFVIRSRMSIPGRPTAAKRTVYQRPLVEFTLLRLLHVGAIDSNLFPPGKQHESLTDELDTTETAVMIGLRNVIGSAQTNAVSTALGAKQKRILQSALEATLLEHTGKTYKELATSVDVADMELDPIDNRQPSDPF